ncbi:hypothetical protein ACXET9_12505 [Brachybacterium sp. DNPG3]
MALRRPVAPRLTPQDAPEAPAPDEPAQSTPAQAAEPTPAPAPVLPPSPLPPLPAPAPDAAPAASAAASAAAPAAAPDAAARRSHRPRRRAVLAAGAAAAVAVPALALVWLKLDPAGVSALAALGIGGSGDSEFPDVDTDDPALEAIRWAHETGVLPALDSGIYDPDGVLARTDLLLALHRLAGAPEVDVDAAPQVFVDLEDSDPCREAALWLHGRAVLWGDTELRIRTADTATGAQAAAMLADLVRPALVSLGGDWDEVAPSIVLDGAELTRRALAAALHTADAAISDALG